MEDLVQKITIHLKTNMELDPNEASKAIEEEVLSLIRSGQVIEVSHHRWPTSEFFYLVGALNLT
jgi:hypothetical protein